MLVGGGITLILGAAFALLIFAVREQRDAGRLAMRSQEAITAGNELQKSVLNLETGLRGYVGTGRESSLAPWYAGLREYKGEARKLVSLVSDIPSQQAEVRGITSDIDDYITLWGQPLLAVAHDNLPVARSVIVNGTGRTRIDGIRARFDKLFTQERAVAAHREHNAEGRSELAIGAGIAGLALVFILAGGTALFMRRFVVKPVKTVAGASQKLADGDMSARVPVLSDDELGDLARAFNVMAESIERSRAEVAEHARELERSNEELDRFASVTSHDLQAPLATISMYVQLLEQRHGDDLGGSGGQIVDGIAQATGHARELIRDLLEYSRAGRGQMRAEEIDTNQLVSEVLDLLAAPIQEADANVSVGRLPTLRADPSYLRQVFQNLIGNAIKFTDGIPVVKVSADKYEGSWRFAIRDNGIGMDPDEAAQIFEPFHRLHGDSKYSGTGIGLAVCERIVEQHGGRIWVETQPGDGSTFRFTLPVSPSAPVTAERDETAVA